MTKKLIAMVFAVGAILGARADTWTDPDTGYTWTYRVNGNTAEIYGRYDSTEYRYFPALSPAPKGTVTVPAMLSGRPVTFIGERSFFGCSELTGLYIPEGVSNIHENAFSGCIGLARVSVPASLTQIAANVFRPCTGLLSFEVADGNPSYKAVSGLLLTKDGNKLVRGVNGDVVVPSGVARIENMAFHGLEGLTSIDIPDSVRYIDYEAFWGCSGLKSISLPMSVVCIGDYAFCFCGGLESFVVDPNNDNYMAESGLLLTKDGRTLVAVPGGLTNVTIPDGVTAIGPWAFEGCEYLSDVEVPYGVKSIGECAFAYCTCLTSVTIPDSVTSIGDNAFAYCSALTDIDIPSGVTRIGDWMFYNCSTLGSVAIPNGVTDIGSKAFYDCRGITNLTFGSGVKNIGEYAFANCDGLASVTIPNSVTNIGNYAFADCYNLTDVQLPDTLKGKVPRSAFPSWIPLPNPTHKVTFRQSQLRYDGAASGGVLGKLNSEGEWTTSVTVKRGQAHTFWVGSLSPDTSVMSIDVVGHFTYKVDGETDEDWVYNSQSTDIQDESGNTTAIYALLTPDDWDVYGVPKSIKFTVTVSGFYDEAVPANNRFSFHHEEGEDAYPGHELFPFDYPVDTARNMSFVEIRDVEEGQSIGELPVVNKRAGWKFLGWFTDPKDGDAVSANTLMGTNDVVYWAHWLHDRKVDVEVGVADDCATMGMVSGGGRWSQNGKASLKATPYTGNVFSGWYLCTKESEELLSQSASYSYAVGGEDVAIIARFASAADDAASLRVNVANATASADGSYSLDLSTCVASLSQPNISVSGLPAGVKFDAKTMTISGKVTKPGVYTVTVSATNATVKNPVAASFTLIVPNFSCDALPYLNSAVDAYVFGAGLAFDSSSVDCGAVDDGWKVAASGLPAGLKFDPKSGTITGVATKEGVYTVTFTATKGKEKQTATITMNIVALPDNVVGVFNGFVKAPDGEKNIGTFQLTATDAGKLTAKVVTAAGSYSFGGTCWDKVEDDVYSATLTTKKGETLTLALDSAAGWNANQLMGSFAAVAGQSPYQVIARKNAFGKIWYFGAAGNERDGWSLSYAENAKAAALTVTLNADGSTKIAGKLGTLSVSASGYADVTGLANGVIYADFAPVVSVKDGKATLKKALSVRANLWFDRSNDHVEGVGSAKLVEED